MTHTAEAVAITRASHRSTLSILFSLFISVSSVIGVYASGIPGLSVADVLLVFFTFMCFALRTRPEGRPIPLGLVALCMYTVVATSTSLLLQGNTEQLSDIVVRTVRYVFYIVCIVFTSRRLFDFDVAKRWVLRVSILATVFILFQYAMYYSSGVIVNGFLSFVPLYESQYASLDYQRQFALMYRPSSFFLEPAWYSQYALVGLCLALFDERSSTARQSWIAALIALGICLSTSLQGVLLSVFAWLYWFARNIIRKTASRSTRFSTIAVGLLVVAPVAAYIVSTPFFQRVVARLQLGGSTSTSALWGRLAGFSSFDRLHGVFAFVGLGNGAVTDTYMSSGAYALYGTGVFGVALIVALLFGCYRRCSSSATRCICIIWSALFVGAFLFHTRTSVFYFSFILYESARSGRVRAVVERGSNP